MKTKDVSVLLRERVSDEKGREARRPTGQEPGALMLSRLTRTRSSAAMLGE